MKKVAEYADTSYNLSSKINQPLVQKILLQSDELPCADEVKEVKSAAVLEFKTTEEQKRNTIKTSQEPCMQRNLEQLSEPGASSWLGALPLQEQGFNLTKGEFQDALALRYGRQVKNLPSKCPCGQAYTVDHALNCHLGGFVNARHDQIRNLECTLLKSVVQDVECEPLLHPVVNKTGYMRSAIWDNDARQDVCARGLGRDGQNAFFDV